MSKNSHLVFSTDQGRIKPAAGAQEALPASRKDDCIRLLRESKGRAGKAVSLIEGIAPEQHKLLCTQLKQRLGCGGSVKNGRIEIQGDRRADIKALLEQQGYRVKISGG